MRTSIAARLGAACVVLSASAGAHDPLRVVASVAAEGRSEPALLRTNRGLVFMAEERGAHLCHAALGAHPSELLPALPVPAGGWVVATSRGIALIGNDGCESPARSNLMGVAVQDVAADPSAAGVLYAITADVAAGSGLYVSADAGLGFEPLLSLGVDEYLSSMLLSPAEPARVYLAASSYDRESRSVSHFLLQYTRGREPVRSEIELMPGEPRVRVVAAHPTEADTLVLHVSASQVGQVARDRLLLSRDAGATLQTWHTAAGIEQLAFSPDGRSAWLASAEGLSRSDDFGPFVGVALERGASSVAWLGEQLYVSDAIALSVSDDQGRSFQPLFHFWDVLEPSSCDAAAIEACRQDWEDLSRELAVAREASLPAAPPGALPAIDDHAPQPSPATAGCWLSAPQTSDPGAAVLTALGLVLARRRLAGQRMHLFSPGSSPRKRKSPPVFNKPPG